MSFLGSRAEAWLQWDALRLLLLWLLMCTWHPSCSLDCSNATYPMAATCPGEPCLRFESGPGLPACKQNMLRFCQTDLATVAYDWSRFRAESRSFYALAADGVVGGLWGPLISALYTHAHTPGSMSVVH